MFIFYINLLYVPYGININYNYICSHYEPESISTIDCMCLQIPLFLFCYNKIHIVLKTNKIYSVAYNQLVIRIEHNIQKVHINSKEIIITI